MGLAILLPLLVSPFGNQPRSGQIELTSWIEKFLVNAKAIKLISEVLAGNELMYVSHTFSLFFSGNFAAFLRAALMRLCQQA